MILSPCSLRDNITAALEEYHTSEGNWLRFGELAKKGLVQFVPEDGSLQLVF
jgi:hypothetical protein